jgi:molybdopterin/thiamine biosynthesis adenylyltransferase
MDYSRILSSIDAGRLQHSTVAVVGVGASRDKVCNLCRCGVGHFRLFDPDAVEPSNVARQGYRSDEVGLSKVEATAAELQRINPAVDVETFQADFTRFSDDQLDAVLKSVDLLILATDRFAAQARGNQVALRLGIPAVWVGIYAGGCGGEVIFWHPGIDACFRCLCSRRYEAHEQARSVGESLDPPSQGVTIFDVHLVDAIAGQLAIGLLTRGSDTRYGRLIDAVGDRDVIGEKLGIAPNCETYFAWNTIVRRDPQQGNEYCPDCSRWRGHAFGLVHCIPIRFKPSATD